MGPNEKLLKNLLASFFLLFAVTSFAQQDDDSAYFRLPPHELREVGFVAGIHQYRSTYLELGIALTKSSYGGCTFGSYYIGHSVNMEYNPFQNNACFSITRWSSLATVITTGISLNSYTDFTHYNLGIKPFIGIGPGFLSLTYGYNFQLINTGVSPINRHTFSVRGVIPVFRY